MITFYNNDISIGTYFSNTKLCFNCMDAILEGLYAIQIKPDSLKLLTLKQTDLCQILLSRYPLVIFCRLPNTFSLNGDRISVAWTGNVDQDNKVIKSIQEIECYLEILNKFEGHLVLNLGCNNNTIPRLQASIITLDKIQFPVNSKLLLENSINNTFENLLYIYTNLSNEIKPHIGFALNLVYFYVNGIHDMSDPENVIKCFKDTIGIFPFTIILEDTLSAFNSNKIHICPLGKGFWTINTLQQLFVTCVKYKIHIIVKDINDVYTIRDIFNVEV